MLDTEGTYKKSDEGHLMEIVLPNPYMWISQNKESVYFQDGEFYRGAGEPPIAYEDVPEWFWSIARKNYNAEGRAKYGLVLPEDRVVIKTSEEITAEKVAKSEVPWKCDEEEGCDFVGNSTNKGAHIARHRKGAKKAKKEEMVLSQ